MPDFYFTYGSAENYPFYGGWTKITAPSINMAIDRFNRVHPSVTGCLNCANYYTKKEFNATSMPTNGNFRAFEHEHITVDIEYQKNERN